MRGLSCGMRAFSRAAHPVLTGAGDLGGMTNWDFHEGDEIAPGLRAVRLLGGGRRYEAHLAWADRLRALVVVKVSSRATISAEKVRSMGASQSGTTDSRRRMRTLSDAVQRVGYPSKALASAGRWR